MMYMKIVIIMNVKVNVKNYLKLLQCQFHFMDKLKLKKNFKMLKLLEFKKVQIV